jgi:hypothetical protein
MNTPLRTGGARWLAILVLAGLAPALMASPATAASPGAPDVGDYLFPGLGNGGYDAQRYMLGVRYPSTKPEQQLEASVRMVATATQDLSRFNLDFAGDAVRSVRVDDEPASFRREAEELCHHPATYAARRALVHDRGHIRGAYD